MKSAFKIGVVVLVVAALATTGVALALESTDPASAAENPAEAGNAPDPAARIAVLLAPLVADGTLTQEVADTVAEHLAESLPQPPRRNLLLYVRDLAREAADFVDMEPLEVVEAVRDGATLADLAVDNGSSGAALVEHLVEEVEDDLEQAVADEKITQEHADAALERATTWITDAVNGDLEGPIFPRPQQPRHPYVRDLAREAADFVDMEPLEVVEAVRDGATLADLAVDNGSSGAALVEHLVEEVEDDLEQAVADEKITQEQADAALERATTWITDAVNGDLEGPIFPRPRGPGPGPGGSGDDPVASPSFSGSEI